MMRSMKAFVVALLFSLPLLASCADNNNPTSPETPAAMQPQDGLIGDLLGGTLGLIGSVIDVVGRIVGGPGANANSAAAWIDDDGGQIRAGAYTLTVPRNAVSKRTRFVVEPQNNGTYTVNLHAYEQRGSKMVEVGSRGFDKPVVLTISYEQATGITNARKLAIVYLLTATQGEVQPSLVVSESKDVHALLKHFSKYAMVQN